MQSDEFTLNIILQTLIKLNLISKEEKDKFIESLYIGEDYNQVINKFNKLIKMEDK